MIKTAITLVRLRWTLTLATLRKSAWQTVAYVFSAVLAAGTIIGAACSHGSSAYCRPSP